MERIIKYLFIISILLTPTLAAQFCGNPYLIGSASEDAYCADQIPVHGDVGVSCCPYDDDSAAYDSSDPFFPDNRSDCEANYVGDSLEDITSCDLGCCHRPHEQTCEDTTRYVCEAYTESTWYPEPCRTDESSDSCG
ncbi:MAG: hypothetical protein ACQESG_04630, partial [Nanobdellota archaeon]